MTHFFRIAMMGILILASYAAVAAEQVLVLIFKEQDPDGSAYISRMIINDAFLRLDYGQDQAGFILFDRNSQVINSITFHDRSVMVIAAKKVVQKSPIKLKLSSKRIASAKVKLIETTEMLHHRFFANELRCFDSFIIPNFIPDASKALKNYYAALAGEHAQTMHRIPEEMLDACDLAINIFSSDRHFNEGFPIRELFYDGKERALLDFDEKYMMDEKWRQIPEDFTRYYPGQPGAKGAGA